MKQKFSFLRLIFLAFAGSLLMTACQKENAPADDVLSSDMGDIIIRTADEVNDQDKRSWGSSEDWLSSKGSLSFLTGGSNLPARRRDFFENVPSGIKVTGNTFVYLTFVGQMANYNNVLGYYYYHEGDLTGNIEEDRAFIMNQIFTSDRSGINLNQVVYYSTKNMAFRSTYKLSNNGKEFEEGTIIGFYLLPNASNGTSPKIWMRDDKPVFISTDARLNITRDLPDEGKISHIMGQSACGDLVIAFEDLNSLYSLSSDEDYNDLVFVVGDNLNRRTVSDIEAYGGTPSPTIFGEGCVLCIDAADELGSLINYISDKPENSIYEPLFDEAYNSGYLPVSMGTPLYAKFAFASANWYNIIGWFTYMPGMTVEDIKQQIADENGVIYTKNIIATDIHNIKKDSSQPFIRIGGSGFRFSADQNVGFFIYPHYAAIGNAPVLLDAPGTAGIRFTVFHDTKGQAEVILKASCDNILVAFEDKVSGDDDYNDVIFHVSDNNVATKLSTISIDNVNFYSLSDLNDRYIEAGAPWN